MLLSQQQLSRKASQRGDRPLPRRRPRMVRSCRGAQNRYQKLLGFTALVVVRMFVRLPASACNVYVSATRLQEQSAVKGPPISIAQQNGQPVGYIAAPRSPIEVCQEANRLVAQDVDAALALYSQVAQVLLSSQCGCQHISYAAPCQDVPEFVNLQVLDDHADFADALCGKATILLDYLYDRDTAVWPYRCMAPLSVAESRTR